MTEPLQVGQFAIVDGEPVDRGPNAGVFHGKGPADDRAELFLLAEGTTPAGDAFAGHVVSALGHAFAALDMSLTGSLRRLFIEAERNLHDWNRKSIAQHRVAIGLTAFGRRGEQAIIAQAGPSIAYHFHQDTVTAYPARGEHARAIGSGPVQPELTRIPFESGDRLLLISSPVLQEVDEELLTGILALPEEQVLPDLYRRVQAMRQVTVILVTGPQPHRRRQREEIVAEDEFVIDATTMPVTVEASDGAMFQPSLFIDDEDESVLRSARAQLLEVTPRRAMNGVIPNLMSEAPAPLLRASGDTSAAISRMAAEGQARAARSRAAVATIVAEAPTLAARPSWRSESEALVAHEPVQNSHFNGNSNGNGGPRNGKTQSFSRGLVPPGAPPTRPEILAEDLPLAAELAAGRRARSATIRPVAETLAAENSASMAGGAPLVRPRSNMGGRWKGSNSFGGGRTSIGGQLPPTWMVIMGALALMIVIAGIATVPRLLDNDNTARVTTLLDGAQQRVASAANQPDAGQKRTMLSEAQAMLLEARDLGGESVQSTELINQVAGAITRMDNVVEPQAVELVASLEQFGTRPVAVSRMAVSADAAYLLDVNSAQVVAVSLTGAEPRVIFAENKDEKRAKPVAIAQLDESDIGGPTLLIADTANRLWGYSGGSLRAVAFAAPGNLTISDITVSGRDLYVLDASQATIFRFVQTADGFPNTPVKAVQNADLGAGRRLLVDAEFITADGDGTIHRFSNAGQTAITFSQAGIDEKLVAPEMAQPVSEDQLAFLDAANDRIVVMRRDGAFDRQYRHPDFANASAFVIRDGQAWLFSGSKLHRVTF